MVTDFFGGKVGLTSCLVASPGLSPVIMPTSKLDDYVVLETIGSGSFSQCKKIRRIHDGKVSLKHPPALNIYGNNYGTQE